jgi:DeoR/GlpR family transcriptional regulator of sugar metabolism
MNWKIIKGLRVKKQDKLNDIFLKMSRGEIKVKNLAKLYDTTERTIQNDIKELSQIYDIKFG